MIVTSKQKRVMHFDIDSPISCFIYIIKYIDQLTTVTVHKVLGFSSKHKGHKNYQYHRHVVRNLAEDSKSRCMNIQGYRVTVPESDDLNTDKTLPCIDSVIKEGTYESFRNPD